ncbi:hypothetical protein FNV43_RR22246 [Rhamnella rubrinervis]|uniref:Uncharacterized protein n=1 Tax=Rhamnella rubrinervis TaxID=2594499 RepID=A0A8K0GQX1_9ROSA|nr:hypothetical protein FNV43_RR22246 [Rhamnella rubrinervis]
MFVLGPKSGQWKLCMCSPMADVLFCDTIGSCAKDFRETISGDGLSIGRLTVTEDDSSVGFGDKFSTPMPVVDFAVFGAPGAAAPSPSVLVDNPNRPATDEVSSIQLTQSDKRDFDCLDIRGQHTLESVEKITQIRGFPSELQRRKPMGSAQQALAAKDTLQNMIFDAESKLVLQTEMAKKKSFRQKSLSALVEELDWNKNG